MENKKTSIEWLLENLINEPFSEEDFKHNFNVWNKAEEMEKQKDAKYNEMLEMLKKVANIRYVGASKKELESIFIETEQLIKSATEL